MKIAKKIAALVCAAALTVAALVVPVGADSIADTAQAISSGKSVSTILPSRDDVADYKITVKSAGTLKLSVESQMYSAYVEVYDSDGNVLSTIDNATTSGSCSSAGKTCHYMYWNSTIEKYKGTVSYSVKAGTYYIRFVRNCIDGNGKLTFTATFPSGESAKKAKVSYININLEKGDTLSLGATVSNGGTVTWKSSNSSVVSVTSTGKITAKAKGTAIITAKCGTSTKKVKIVVS